MYHHKTTRAKSLKQTAADTLIAISARINSRFLFFLLLDNLQVLLILLDRVLISVDTITINTLLNKDFRKRSREENDVTSNKLLDVIYVLHSSLSVPCPDKGSEGQLDPSLAQPAWHGARQALRGGHTQPWWAHGFVASWLTPRCAVRINGTSHLKEDFRVLSKGSLDRMFRVWRQMMNIQQGQANPILCALPQEITPFLPVMLGSLACIRQFRDETFLGEWMLWQMLSAGNLLKGQLVRGYCSCSVEHSWFTQNGLKM